MKREVINELFSFYEDERKSQRKSKKFMRKIYENRLSNILKKEENVTEFLFCFIWELYLSDKFSEKILDLVTKWFNTALLEQNLINYIDLMRTRLK